MSNSTQINTGPTLRQFATFVDGDDLVVTSKLGTSTLSRVRFKQLDYPAGKGEGAEFLKKKILSEFPVAESVLGKMFDQCVTDQAKAVRALLGA